MRRLTSTSAVLCVFMALARAEEPVDLQMISRIKAEAVNNSKVMETLGDLIDNHGPRLSGTRNYRAAAEWCRDRFKEWGLSNANVEPWGKFGRGWTLKRFRIEMLEPYYLNIIAYPKAWTAGTDGVISGTPVFVDADAPDALDEHAGRLEGAIVLLGAPTVPQTSFEPDAQRYTEEGLAGLLKASLSGGRRPPPDRQRPAAARDAGPAQPREGGPAAGPGERPGRARDGGREDFRARRGRRNRLMEALRTEGVGCILEPSRGAHGTMFVQSGGSRDANADPALPSLVVAAEHYALIARLIERNIPVKLELSVEAEFTPDEVDDYNVVAEIPGADPQLGDELVMLGGHLDSWHSSNCATDNGAGCAVVMEAMRILKAVDAKPRRTIRAALWGAEEHGLIGSREYVRKHFGDRETMSLTENHPRFSAYYNLDNGTGRIRGVYCQSNDAVRPIFEAWLRPFHDMDAATVTVRNTGGTDHQSFDGIGLPGFQFIQDEIDYDTRTHHTNMDTFERALPDDLKQASIIMASFAYHTAMRDEKLPRKPLPQPRPRSRDDDPAATQPAGVARSEGASEPPPQSPPASEAPRPAGSRSE